MKIIFAFSIMLLMATTPDLDPLSELNSLVKADSKGAVSKDIEMTRSFIEEANTADGGASKKRLRKRADLAMELVRALVSAAQISDAADAQETAAYSAPETLKVLKEKVDALSKRRDALKKTIKQLEK